ncbi:hypothetical protein STXM2123_2947 [Streptomyces sp. F-3]|nr:hypothetical protein STXM2123_2947 [Streptomyces sp. F-3]
MTVDSPGDLRVARPRPRPYERMIRIGQGVTTGSLYPAQRATQHLGYGRHGIR